MSSRRGSAAHRQGLTLPILQLFAYISRQEPGTWKAPSASVNGRRPTENRRHGTGHGSHPASHSARHLGMGCFFPLSKLDTHPICHPICIASRDLKPRGAPPSGDNSPDRQPGPSALLPPNADVDRHPLTECHYSLDKLSTPANLPRVVIVQNPPRCALSRTGLSRLHASHNKP